MKNIKKFFDDKIEGKRPKKIEYQPAKRQRLSREDEEYGHFQREKDKKTESNISMIPEHPSFSKPKEKDK